MPDVPKIVYRRLQAQVPVGPHPDPDQLTAFAEEALSAAERERILQHLASCVDCRDVLALALPEVAEVVMPAETEQTQAAAPVRKERRDWFAWARLRWAVAATAVIVVGSVLTLVPGPWSRHKVASVSAPSAKADLGHAAAPPAAELDAQERRTTSAPAEQLQAKLEPEASGQRAKLRSSVPPSKPAVTRDLGPARSELASNQPAGKFSPSGAAGALARKTASEDVEVSNAVVTTVPAPASPELMARNEAPAALPIEKAKPPVQEQETKESAAGSSKQEITGAMAKTARTSPATNLSVAQAPSSFAQWKLSGGVLQRSLDQGTTWQTVLRADHPLLCHAARDKEIWAGGQAGTLYYSGDGGATWTEQHPAVNGQPLTGDIMRVEVQKPGETTLTTSTGQSWITMDNGKSWEKK